jgi:hypothetical protein
MVEDNVEFVSNTQKRRLEASSSNVDPAISKGSKESYPDSSDQRKGRIEKSGGRTANQGRSRGHSNDRGGRHKRGEMGRAEWRFVSCLIFENVTN